MLWFCVRSPQLSVNIHQGFFECVYPEDEWQNECQEIIDTILAGKHSLNDALKLIDRLNIYAAEKSGKLGLVLGCTEFSQFNEQYPLVNYGLSEKYEIVDPTLIVAERLCKLFIRI